MEFWEKKLKIHCGLGFFPVFTDGFLLEFHGWNGTLKPPSLLTLAKFTADVSLFGRSKPAISF